MSAAAYWRAAVPEPYRILGLTLRPLSLGRYRLLRRFECGFVSETATDAGIGDLLIGLLICSMPCADFVDWAASPDFTRDIRRWSRRVCPLPWLCAVPIIGPAWARWRSFNIVEKCELFARYIDAHTQMPAFWEEQIGSSPSGAHWSLAVEVALRSELHWTIEEINEQPLSKALADYFKLLENHGVVRLMTDYELSTIEAAEKLNHN